MIARPAIAVVLLAALLAPPKLRAAGLADAGPTANRIDFRRIKVPVGQEKQWPTGAKVYLPIPSAEFERLTADTADSSATSDQQPLAAAVQSARYELRLVGGDTLEGQALLDIGSTAKDPTLMPLEPLKLAIGEAAWIGKSPPKALLGSTGRGPLLLLVPRAGTLKFTCSQRGQIGESGSLAFDVELPLSAANTLDLELPAAWTPQVDRAVAMSISGKPAGPRRWSFALGRVNRFVLRLTRAAPNAAGRAILLRQADVYNCTSRGVDLTSQFKLDVLGEAPRQLRLQVDRALTVLTVEAAGKPLAWSLVAPSTDGDAADAAASKPQQIVVEFPDSSDAGVRDLRVTAVCPLVVDRRWKLPKIQGEGLVWREQTVALQVASPLVIDQLYPLRCRQTKFADRIDSGDGEMIELQLLAADSEVELLLKRQPDRLQTTAGATFTLPAHATNPQQHKLRVRGVNEFTVASGERFVLEADVPRDWLVDKVETVPSEALAEKNLVDGPGNSQRLTIRLSKALSPGVPLRVITSGHREINKSADLSGGELRWLTFRDAAVIRQLAAVATKPTHQIKLNGGEELPRLDPRQVQLSTADRNLLTGDLSGAIIFQLNDASINNASIHSSPQAPRFRTEISSRNMLHETQLTEEHNFAIRVESGVLSRLVVHFSEPQNEPFIWTSDDGLTLNFKKLDAEEQRRMLLGGGGESWELSFNDPPRDDFRLHATRTVKWSDDLPLNLAYVAEAVSQHGVIEVRGQGSLPLEVHNERQNANRRLKAIIADRLTADRYSDLLAAYHYEPADDALAESEPALRLRVAENSADHPDAWAWRAELMTSLAASGKLESTTTYWIENRGQRRIHFTLPAPLSLDHVSLGGETIVPRGDAEHDRLAVDLPAGRRFIILSIRCRSPRSDGLLTSTLRPVMPQLDIPVLSRRGLLWLPPDCELAAPIDRRASARLTWSQRVFGPLARQPGQPIFDPFSLTSWHAVGLDLAGLRLEQVDADRLLAALFASWQQLPSRRAGSAELPTWGELLVDVRRRLAGDEDPKSPSAQLAKRDWRVDASALSRLHLTSRWPVPAATGDASPQNGAELLAQANLALLVRPQTIVLTAAALEPSASGQAGAQLARRAPLTAASQIGPNSAESFDEVAAASRLLPLDIWNITAQWVRDEPWPTTGQAAAPWNDHRGWKALEFEISDADPHTLIVTNTAAQTAVGWAAFLTALSLAWWQLVQHPRRLSAALIVAGCAALVAPHWLRPLFSAAILGTALAALLGVFRLRRLSIPAAPSVRIRLGETMAAATLAGAVVLLFSVIWLPSGRAAATETEVFDVLIPVDAAGKPSGDQYYVVESLFRRLQQIKAARSAPVSRWLLSDATYDAELQTESPGRLAPGDVRAHFTLYALDRDARIVLPLGGDGASLVPGSILLDNRPATVDRDWREGAIVLDVDEAGEHQLDVTLRPHPRSGDSGAGWEMSVPALATARLNLTGPGRPAWEVPGVLGGMQTKITNPPQGESRRTINAALGAIARLQVRWTSADASTGKPPEAKVDELLRLHVQPGFMTLDAHFSYQVTRGKLQRLLLNVDPRLQLLRLPKDSPVARISPRPGDGRQWEVELVQPVGDKLELDLPFYLPNAASAEKFRMPLVESVKTGSLKTGRRWLGLWIDAALEETPGKQLKPLAVADFASAWRGETRSQTAFQLPPDGAEWTLSVKPRESKTTSRQTLVLTCDAQRLKVGLGATLVNSGAYRWGYRVTAPKDFIVQRVSVRDGAAERLAHWSRDDSGMLHLFLNGGSLGEQKLLVQGELARKQSQESKENFKLPDIHVEGVELAANAALIYRRSDVNVVPADSALASADAQASAAAIDAAATDGLLPPDGGRGQLIACLLGNRARPGSNWTLAANRPQISPQQSLTLSREGEGWQATLDFLARIDKGEVDLFYFWVSPAWRGPFAVEPAEGSPQADVRLVDVPGETNRLMIVQPRTSVRKKYRVTIRGPITVAADERIRVPEVIPTSGGNERFLVLPNQLELQELHWDLRDLKKEASLPADLAAPAATGGPTAMSVYRVIGDERYRARLQSIDRIPGIPQLRLADVSLAWTADGTLVGAAIFDLAPAGLDKCTLQLPEGCRLLHASLGGQPAGLRAAADNRWTLELGRAQLPQRIEVLYAGRSAGLEGQPERRRFDLPLLVGLPPERILAAVFAPPHAGQTTVERAVSVVPQRFAQFRLESVQALLAATASGLLEEPSEEIDRWSSSWFARLRSAQIDLQRSQPLHEIESRKASAALLAQFNQEQAKLAERLASAGTLKQAIAEASLLLEPTDLFAWSCQRGQPPLVCTMPGDAKNFTVEYTPEPSDDFGKRLAAALLVLSGLAALFVFRQQLPLESWLERWPHAVGVIAGLAWWLWLSPSWLGWLIVLACLATSLIPARRLIRPAPPRDGNLSTAMP